MGLVRTFAATAIDARLALREGERGIARRAVERQLAMVAWARSGSPFYRRHYHGLLADITSLQDVPPVTKPELMAEFDDWVTDGAVLREDLRTWLADPETVGRAFRGKYLVYTTSGTTGEPAVLLEDEASLAAAYASRARMVPGFLTREITAEYVRRRGAAATVLATGGPYGGIAMVKWALRINPLIRGMVAYSVNDPLPQMVAQLNAQRPVVLSGYTSSIELLADEALAGRLRIAPLIVATLAEGYSANGKALIERAWGVPIIDTYACSEMPIMAIGCPHGRLHHQVDWVTLEPVDEAYRPVPDGETSYTVLVTNHFNRVQPIVRYDLGDSITVDPNPCPCGSPLPVIRVEGRSRDLLLLRDAAGETIRILPLAISSVAEEAAGVHRVQLVQTAPSEIVIRLEAEPGADRAAVAKDVQDKLRTYLRHVGLANVALVGSDDSPTLSGSGKFRGVYREAGATAPA